MTHARRETTERSGRRPRCGRPVAWLFAWLVMCFAVLPHVTLAASLMQMPGQPHHRQVAEAGPAKVGLVHAPCHQASPAGHPAAAKPLCCVVGCGLIAEAPAAPLLLERTARSGTPPPAAMAAKGLATEPAEPPPRSRQST